MNGKDVGERCSINELADRTKRRKNVFAKWARLIGSESEDERSRGASCRKLTSYRLLGHHTTPGCSRG